MTNMTRPRKGKSHRSNVRRGKIADPRVQIKSTPAEVTVRMRLGVNTSIPLNNEVTVNTVRINDPFVMVENFGQRGQDFATYRITQMQLFLTPNSTQTTITGSNTRQWCSAILTSATAPIVSPSNISQLLELPQAQVRPMDLSNPLSRRRLFWRATDVNSLTYTNRSLQPELTTVQAYCSVTGPALTGWAILFTGWMEVEFKGLAVF